MMRLSYLPVSYALLIWDVYQRAEFKKPLLEYVQKKACQITKLVLHELPYVSSLFRHYDLITEVLTEVQRHVISFEKISGCSSLYIETKKEIGEFFSKECEPFLGAFQNESYWNIHHEAFRKLSLEEINQLLQKVYDHTDDPELFQAQVAQILSKRLVSGCWSKMKEGFGIKIPIIDQMGNKKMVSYVLDYKFDLWQDIPAFGFKDIHDQEAPILIFRGTNPNTNFADSWPSILANLHPKGPAWKLYEQSHGRIETWLDEVTRGGENKARLMGFSQGSALASYFLTYKSKWISQKENEASYLFAGPGISKEVYEDWKKLSEHPKVSQYVSRGDLVPKVGEGFVGKVFEVSQDRRVTPAEAHSSLDLLSPRFKCREIDLSKELQSRIRKTFSYIQKSTSHYFYPVLRTYVIPKIQKVFYDVHFSS